MNKSLRRFIMQQFCYVKRIDTVFGSMNTPFATDFCKGQGFFIFHFKKMILLHTPDKIRVIYNTLDY